jgi:hypothetical protein
MIENTETVSLGWCDNGTTDGKFSEGLAVALISGPTKNIKITSSIRVQGNQIGRQRQALFDNWADDVKTDWLLWVDSDILLNLESLKLLWETANKDHCPVISGVYFILKETDGEIPVAMPALFNSTNDQYQMEYIHPLPQNEIINIDYAGFGFLLMHKSIVSKIREANPGKSLFAETADEDKNHFVGEDIIFFRRMKNAKIPLYAHTGAIVKHIKQFGVDINYYSLYWSTKK